ncbi:MAG TPA: HAD-IIIC family phosphatase [Candidatus Binatia bacterium]|jgi:FkbH-like protein
MSSIGELVEKQDYKNAWEILLDQARHVQDYTEFVSLCQWREKLAKKTPSPNVRKSVKIALLGGATTEIMEAPLVLALEALGLGCELLRSDYNTFAHEMLDPASATAAFKPEVAIVVNCPVNIPSWPNTGDDLERVKQISDEVCRYWINLCAKLHEHTQCEVVLNNFHPLATAPSGNLGAKLPWDANNFVRRVNRELGDRLPGYVHVNDVESLSAKYGLVEWFDPRFWFHAKQPVSFGCLVPYVRNTARIVGALFGRSAKCLVLDLDNTLWGGVVGDDGPEGLVIGEGDPIGEAFKTFQEYLLRLKKRGVMLAVCSKNEESNALAAFEKRPEMPLKREDFVAFKANWLSKPDNIAEIAAELNIGIDALVFVDDNPAEREHVRRCLPEVKVVGLSDDPADYPRLLDEAGMFETTAVSKEDQERTQKYQENVLRARLEESAADYRSYLVTLQQRAVIRPFDEMQLDRITQLINKTNQFNLTTLRQSRSQVEALMRDSGVMTAYVRLADRFGDNGLISVFFAHREDEILWVDEWLMSCRVLKRGVEQLLCNYVAEKARALGLTSLHGVYRPTPANKLVADHYRSLGFVSVEAESNGATHWRLDLASYQPSTVAILTVEEY